jgi:hydrogenase maturation protein HypF
MALSYLDMAYGSDLWELPIPWIQKMDRSVAEVVLRASRRRLNSPMTTSCGRLFDAVAALTGVRQTVSYEGQAAIELEMALGHGPTAVSAGTGVYPFPVDTPTGSDALVLDPMPLTRAVVEDLVAEVPVCAVSHRFHAALVQALLRAIDHVAGETGLREVVLSGGCFCNRFLTDGLVTALAGKGLAVFTHQVVPPGDGGLALGQAVVAVHGEPPCRR